MAVFDENMVNQIRLSTIWCRSTLCFRQATLTLRLLMSYIYMERLFLMFLDHTQWRSTVGRTPLGEWSARRRDLYLTTHDTHNRQISMPPVGFEPTISLYEIYITMQGSMNIKWILSLEVRRPEGRWCLSLISIWRPCYDLLSSIRLHEEYKEQSLCPLHRPVN